MLHAITRTSRTDGVSLRVSLRVRLGLVALVFLVLAGVGLSTLMLRSWGRTLDRRGEARMTADVVAELDAEPDAAPGDGGPNANAGDGPATARAALSHGGTMRP